jgi:hypothetical protein
MSAHSSPSRKAFAAVLAVSLFVGMISRAGAADYVGYVALDQSQPVSFDGKTVKWNGKTFALDQNTIFLDSRLERAQLAGNPHAFNNLKDAAAALKNGTVDKPMLLLTAPGVFWVDDPDDPAIRGGGGGGAPVGMTIACDNLYFYGLNTSKDNVIFAVNRGQTQGSAGNFTMFRIQGTGLKSENVTFGNYCNVDLKFPLDPSLSRTKRADAIAQAQLFSYNGNDGVAINSGFVSRLNLLPFAMTYINCHIESSGHASFQSSVYIGCKLEFYGTNYSSGKFFNCDIYLKPSPAGYRGRSTHRFGFTDGTGRGGVCMDTRFHRSQEMIDNNVAAEVSWDRVPQSATTRGYQYNVTLDGKPYVIQETATPGATVVIPEGSDLLKAYKVTHGGHTYYNVPNVLSGVDPFGYAPGIKAAALEAGKVENYYLSIPLTAALRVASGSNATIRSGQTTMTLTCSVAPAAYASSPALGKWQFTSSNPGMVQITPGSNNSIAVAGTNKTAAPVDVIIAAKNELGLEACATLKVEPAFVEPPKFTRDPAITLPADGRVTLGYALDLGSDLRKDESSITWYRCTDAEGSNPLKVAVSRRNKPEIAYTLSEGDVGYYLMATIRPKHSLSEMGPVQTVYARAIIARDDVKSHVIDTDFQNFPADPQPKILSGTWTLDGSVSPEVGRNNTPRYTANPNSWTYGPGQSGSINYHGLYPTARGARLFYTPAAGKYDAMKVCARFAPNKNSGQGFGSATEQFLDVYIKYDLATNTGYGLRIQRLTTEEINAIGYKGAGAVAGCAFFLVKYENGVMTPVSKKVMSSAFLAECTVELTARNGRLLATVTSTEGTRSGDAFDYPRAVQFDVPVESSSFGGTGMLFTGTVGVNSVLVTGWQASWPR